MATRRVLVQPYQVTAAKLLVKIAERDGRTVSPAIQMIADAGRPAPVNSPGRTANGAPSAAGVALAAALRARASAGQAAPTD